MVETRAFFERLETGWLLDTQVGRATHCNDHNEGDLRHMKGMLNLGIALKEV